MDPSQLVDRTFGPHPLDVDASSVADFVHFTGDDPDRWTDAAPPGFAAAALFAVAPELLDEVSDRSVLHGEQSFDWAAPIEVGTTLDVRGTVSRARERAGVHFIGFDLEADRAGRRILSGSSLFVLSGESLPGGADFERPEPPHSHRGVLGAGQVSASRYDLIRYAAATRDWNPIHWDHGAAVAAGLSGVIVHGLLQAAWALESVTREIEGQAPLSSARVRFRSPLLPARPVDVRAETGGGRYDVTLCDDSTTYLTARIVPSNE